MATRPNIVLVHRAWADGSCWSVPDHFAVDIDRVNARVVPPDAERQFAERTGADTIEIASGHCAIVSHPEATYERIVTAANVAVPG